jgi:hypothetical protein
MKSRMTRNRKKEDWKEVEKEIEKQSIKIRKNE